MRNLYLPQSIIDSLPYTLDDDVLLSPLVSTYTELKRGAELGLYVYDTSGDDVIFKVPKDFKERLKSLCNKYDDALILLELTEDSCPAIPRSPKEIASELYRAVSLHGLSKDDAIETVKAVTGYTRFNKKIYSAEDELYTDITRLGVKD